MDIHLNFITKLTSFSFLGFEIGFYDFTMSFRKKLVRFEAGWA